MSRPLTVITGGTRGIGAATALRLAADGHDLVLGYLGDVDAADATTERVRAAGAACLAVQVDVADPKQVDGLFDAAAELGPLHGLVNNAGATLHIGALADTPVDVVERVIEVNLTGAVLCARRAVQDLRDGGVIAFFVITVAAAEAAVGLAQEVAVRGIRVNAVAPGIVRTDIHADAGEPGRLDRVVPRVPLGRVGEPDEVAAAISWLMSDACPYATGAVLRVAGGR